MKKYADHLHQLREQIDFDEEPVATLPTFYAQSLSRALYPRVSWHRFRDSMLIYPETELHGMLARQIQWDNRMTEFNNMDCEEMVSSFLPLLTQGIPDPNRRDVWLWISGARFLHACEEMQACYDARAELALGESWRDLSTADLKPFLHFAPDAIVGEHVRMLNQRAIAPLLRILAVVGATHPELEHCPALVHMAAIFLAYLTEGEVWGILTAILEKDKLYEGSFTGSSPLLTHTSLPPPYRRFLARSQREYRTFSHAVYLMLTSSSPKIIRHLEGMAFDLHPWLAENAESLLCHLLPFQMALRLVDCYLAMGVSSHICFLVSYMKYMEQDLCNCWSPEDLIACLDMGARKLTWSDFLSLRQGMHIDPVTPTILAEAVKAASSERFGSTSMLTFTAVSGPSIVSPRSNIVSRSEIANIWRHVPSRFQTRKLLQSWNTTIHGTAWLTFKEIMENVASPLLFFVETQTSKRFGFYASQPMVPCSERFFGDSSVFVFHLPSKNDDTDSFVAYHWSGANRYFLRCADHSVLVGGGDGHPAILLTNHFEMAILDHCETFDCPPLTLSISDIGQVADFDEYTDVVERIHAIEIYALSTTVSPS